MADTIAQSADSRTPANTGDGNLRVGRSRRWRGVVLTAIFMLVATSAYYFAQQYSRDCAIELQLTGSYVSNYVRDDGTEDPFVWQFLADGTMRHYPKGKPPAETGSVDDHMWWHVSGGMLVLTYDRQFPRDASLRWKANHAITYVREFATGKNAPAARHDRCIIRDAGQDSIELSLHPDENTLDSWFGGGPSVLTRTSDGITKIGARDRDCSEAPPTPPGVRVRTGRFSSSQ